MNHDHPTTEIGLPWPKDKGTKEEPGPGQFETSVFRFILSNVVAHEGDATYFPVRKYQLFLPNELIVNRDDDSSAEEKLIEQVPELESGIRRLITDRVYMGADAVNLKGKRPRQLFNVYMPPPAFKGDQPMSPLRVVPKEHIDAVQAPDFKGQPHFSKWNPGFFAQGVHLLECGTQGGRTLMQPTALLVGQLPQPAYEETNPDGEWVFNDEDPRKRGWIALFTAPKKIANFFTLLWSVTEFLEVSQQHQEFLARIWEAREPSERSLSDGLLESRAGRRHHSNRRDRRRERPQAAAARSVSVQETEPEAAPAASNRPAKKGAKTKKSARARR